MSGAQHLKIQDWMTAPETRAVIEALSAEGAEVRFVGGCVRDALAGRPVKDLDLATPDPPERVTALLERAGLKAVPTGIDHGTVTAVASHRPFQITTLRHDVESHGRHATVAFTDDWRADAARRDFTFNAMSCRPDGTLFDPFGGQADLAAGRVRFVGAAADRIEEDYLRLLRFFRFQAHYGRGAPDPEGLAAAARLAPELVRLSGERLRDEILKLLAAPDPVPVLDTMAAQRILAPVLPELGGGGVLAALIAFALEAQGPDVLLPHGALLIPGADAVAVAQKLRLSKADGARLVGMTDRPEGLAAGMAGPGLRRAVYRMGKVRVGDLLRLDWARRQAAGQAVPGKVARANLGATESWPLPRFPLKGRDALELGLAPGAAVGRLLAEVETWWESADFQPNRADCLARLKVLMAEED